MIRLFVPIIPLKGFIGVAGYATVAFYYAGLSGYFLLAIYFGHSDDTISECYEPFVHIFSILYGLIGASVGRFQCLLWCRRP